MAPKKTLGRPTTMETAVQHPQRFRRRTVTSPRQEAVTAEGTRPRAGEGAERLPRLHAAGGVSRGEATAEDPREPPQPFIRRPGSGVGSAAAGVRALAWERPCAKNKRET